MKNVLSLDLESLSLDPHAVIIQIGAVVFDADESNSFNELRLCQPNFNMTVDWQGQKMFKRVMDEDTIRWWNRQNPKVIERMLNNPDVNYLSAITMFDAWLASNIKQYGIEECWVKGNRDGVWIETAFESIGKKFPISYRGMKCVRTLSLSLDVPCPIVPEATPHDAISDAIVQAMHLQECMALLRKYNGALANSFGEQSNSHH